MNSVSTQSASVMGACVSHEQCVSTQSANVMGACVTWTMCQYPECRYSGLMGACMYKQCVSQEALLTLPSGQLPSGNGQCPQCYLEWWDSELGKVPCFKAEFRIYICMLIHRQEWFFSFHFMLFSFLQLPFFSCLSSDIIYLWVSINQWTRLWLLIC